MASFERWPSSRSAALYTYQVTSHIRNTPLLGPYSRTSYGHMVVLRGGAASYERGTPVWDTCSKPTSQMASFERPPAGLPPSTPRWWEGTMGNSDHATAHARRVGEQERRETRGHEPFERERERKVDVARLSPLSPSLTTALMGNSGLGTARIRRATTALHTSSSLLLDSSFKS